MKFVVMIWFCLSAQAEVNLNDPTDPRLANSFIATCAARVQDYMSSDEFANHRDDVIKACKDVDGKCVTVAGDSLSSEERNTAANFLPVIRACKGRGMGDCLEDVFGRVASFDRSTSKQVVKLLKKCE